MAALSFFASATPSEPSHPLEGFGAQTPGGAGQPFCRVTTLADRGPGSFRQCFLYPGGSRTVVFDVGGDILLESPVRIFGAFVTIDGFSAPPPGITLRRHGLHIHGTDGAHDVIVRGLRVRGAAEDGFQIAWGAFNVVLDHVSVDGSTDGNVDVTHGARDVTVQWSILGRTTMGKNSLIKTQQPGLPETTRVSVHHTLFTESAFRNPRISHYKDGSAWATEVTADLRNNVIANWDGGLGTDVECGAWANVVGNLYTSPASGRSDQEQAIVVRGDSEQVDCPRGGRAFVHGNVSGTALGVDINTNPINVKGTATVPFPAARVTTEPTCDAAVRVATSAGAPIPDAVDMDLLARLSLGVCGPFTRALPSPPPSDGGAGGNGGASPAPTPSPSTGTDLLVIAASAPAEVNKDTNFEVRDTVKNIGDREADSSFKVGIFISADAIVNPRDDKQIGGRLVEQRLSAGAESSGTHRVRINRPGTFWLGVCADTRRAVGEASESNNCLAIGNIVVK